MYLNSMLMMVSIHAFKFTHMRHHKYTMTEQDHEGRSAGITWYGAILYGPVHMFLIHKVTLQLGNRNYRRNVIVELLSIAAVVFVAFYFCYTFKCTTWP